MNQNLKNHKSKRFKNKKTIKNQNGQGMIEYIIIVALIAVAAIGSVKLLQKSVNVTLANSINGLQGRDVNKIQHEQVRPNDYSKKDLSDFFKGAANGRKNIK
jgi:pilus assembly protein Flp/PilA